MTYRKQIGSAIGWTILIATWLAVPLVIDAAYPRSLIILVGIYTVFALSYDIVVGHAGVVSFGHAGFFALGAYAMGIGTTRWGLPVIVSLIIGCAISVVVSLLLGAVSMRVSGHYFAISTLAFAELFRIVLMNAEGVTRGPLGLVIRPGSAQLIPGVTLRGEDMVHLLVWGTVVLSTYGVARMQVSSTGWAFQALRENDQLASAVGLDPLRVRVAAFAVSGALGCVAGVFYASYYGVLTPDVSSPKYTVIALLAIMLGGRGTVAGPVIGATVFVVLPQLLGLEGSWNEVLVGVVLLVTLRVLPRGLSHGLTYLTGGRIHHSSATAASPVHDELVAP